MSRVKEQFGASHEESILFFDLSVPCTPTASPNDWNAAYSLSLNGLVNPVPRTFHTTQCVVIIFITKGKTVSPQGAAAVTKPQILIV